MEKREEPFQTLDKLRTYFQEMVDQSFREQFINMHIGDDHWAPLADVFEAENTIFVKAEIPGLERDDIQVEIKNNKLVISGERPLTFREGEAAYQRLERPHGPFRKIIDLPTAVDVKAINANYEDGVLSIQLPLAHSRDKQPIPIQVKP